MQPTESGAMRARPHVVADARETVAVPADVVHVAAPLAVAVVAAVAAAAAVPAVADDVPAVAGVVAADRRVASCVEL